MSVNQPHGSDIWATSLSNSSGGKAIPYGLRKFSKKGGKNMKSIASRKKKPNGKAMTAFMKIT